jgi:hypothetical protein
MALRATRSGVREAAVPIRTRHPPRRFAPSLPRAAGEGGRRRLSPAAGWGDLGVEIRRERTLPRPASLRFAGRPSPQAGRDKTRKRGEVKPYGRVSNDGYLQHVIRLTYHSWRYMLLE